MPDSLSVAEAMRAHDLKKVYLFLETGVPIGPFTGHGAMPSEQRRRLCAYYPQQGVPKKAMCLDLGIDACYDIELHHFFYEVPSFGNFKTSAKH